MTVARSRRDPIGRMSDGVIRGAFASATLLSLVGLFPSASASAQGPVAAGIEFQVNLVTIHSQEQPAVASDADGDFVVTWESDVEILDTSSFEIFARRYSRTGVPQGGVFQVNTYTTGY